MSSNSRLNDLIQQLAASKAAGEAARSSNEQRALQAEVTEVARIIAESDVHKKLRSGETPIEILQLTENHVESSLFSGGEQSESSRERAKRIAVQICACRPEHLRGVAASVFQTCKEAGLNPCVEVKFAYHENIPYITVRP